VVRVRVLFPWGSFLFPAPVAVDCVVCDCDKIVERVCQAADVAYMGKSASVKASTQNDDPVMRRAFGYDQNYSLLDE
jgi:hypothetical protein